MSGRRVLIATVTVALGGCAQALQGPSLAGYPGLQYQIESFYSARALEENATCTQPRMRVSGYKVVEDTPARLVLDVRYRYLDEGQRDFDEDIVGGGFRFSFGTGSCDSFASRTFVMAKGVGGPAGAAPTVTVQSMTGPQRQLPAGSALQ